MFLHLFAFTYHNVLTYIYAYIFHQSKILAFTSPKLTTETVEPGATYVKS